MTEASSSMNSTSSSSSETETEDESSASAAETEDSGEEDSGENDVDLDGERCRRLSRALEALTKYAWEKAPAAALCVPLFVCMLFCVLGLDARARGLRFTQEIPGAFDLFCFGRGVSLLAEDDAEGALGFLRGNVPDSGFLDDDENEEESSEDEGVRSAVWFAS